MLPEINSNPQWFIDVGTCLVAWYGESCFIVLSILRYTTGLRLVELREELVNHYIRKVHFNNIE